MARSSGIGRLAVGALLIAALSGLQVSAADRPSASATTRVVIQVQPSAEAMFSGGSDFVLEVPSSHRQPIAPAVVAFEVSGNAPVEVRLGPGGLLTIGDGRVLGAATGHGDAHKNQQGEGHATAPGKGHGDRGEMRLGYVIAVIFPAPALDKPVDRLNRNQIEALLSQANSGNIATAEVLFDPAQHGPAASGLILVASERDWTENSEDASRGFYSGALQMTVAVRER